MPIYVMKCPECEHEFEVLRPIRDRNASVACDKCGGKMKNTPAASSFRVKGYSYANSYSKKEG